MSLLIGDIIRRNAAATPNALAATLADRSLTHRQLDRESNRLAHTLRGLGIRRGDRVVSWADTSLDVLPLFGALAKLGAVFAPIASQLEFSEATDIVRLARPSLIVAGPHHIEAAEGVAEAAGVPRIGRIGGEPGPGTDLSPDALDASREAPKTPDLVESDTHVLFFTSGSTGRPKGVVLSHRANYLRTFQGVFRDEPERSVCMFPLFHMAAFTLALAAWQTRGRIDFVDSASAEEILDTVERHRGNRLYCIPAVWARILEASRDRWDTSSLREIDTGTSATPPELIVALRDRFPNTATRIYYGSTECGAGSVLADADVERKPGSVGLPPPGVELGLTVGGEIRVRSDFLMDGYFENNEATEGALIDGWYHTGDLGALDDEGYLSITGRLRDVIRSGGETIAPAEVEAVLADHPGVSDVAVVGLPDPRWGEIVCAVVVPRGDGVDLEALQRHCEGRIAPFKKPRRLEFTPELPRTAATRQVQRPLVVERILASMTSSKLDS